MTSRYVKRARFRRATRAVLDIAALALVALALMIAIFGVPS